MAKTAGMCDGVEQLAFGCGIREATESGGDCGELENPPSM